MLDYRIYTFISLCETRSYTKTAEQLHISQPSVSQHIKALEQHYGCDLFYFEGRNLKLTKEGRYLYQKEVGIMTNEKEIESYIEQMANGKHLRIGMTPSVSESFVQQLRGNLANGTLDVVFSEQFFLNGSIFEQHIYHQEQLTLVSDPATAARLYGRSVSAILKETLLLPPEGSGLREIIMHWLNSRSMALTDFERVIVVNSITMIREMLAQQIGVSILFESNVREDVQNRRLQRLQMDDFFLWGNFQFVYLKESLSKDLYTDFFRDFQNMVTEHAHLPTVPYQFN